LSEELILKQWLKRWLVRFINFWPPFIGAGIRVKKISRDFRYVKVEMPLRFYNVNYVGVHFGGSLYAMTDPFYMLMLMQVLGPSFVVWDKAASIRFRRPGKGRVSAEFQIEDHHLEAIQTGLDGKSFYDAKFLVLVKDETGTVVAEIEKVVYVKRKERADVLIH